MFRTLVLRCFLGLALAGTAAAPVALRGQTDAELRRETIDALYPIMIASLEAKNFMRARRICEQVILWEPQNPVHHYNLACIEAQSGRLPQAFAELELAVALGFNDVEHLKNDPDLVPLHRDARFAEIVRKVAFSETVDDVVDSLKIPRKKAASPSAQPTPPAVMDGPAPATFREGAPVGLYYMTRYWPLTRTAEKSAWYFAPDGTVYQNIRNGFSAAELAAHAGPRGQLHVEGAMLRITGSDGQTTTARLERDGEGFVWDMGIFTPVRPFAHASELVGNYDGGDVAPVPSDRRAAASRLELRSDGTFIWVEASPPNGASDGALQGRWELQGLSLILMPTNGEIRRGLAFPHDDSRTVVKPDHLFFAGSLYRRRM